MSKTSRTYDIIVDAYLQNSIGYGDLLDYWNDMFTQDQLLFDGFADFVDAIHLHRIHIKNQSRSVA